MKTILRSLLVIGGLYLAMAPTTFAHGPMLPPDPWCPCGGDPDPKPPPPPSNPDCSLSDPCAYNGTTSKVPTPRIPKIPRK